MTRSDAKRVARRPKRTPKRSPKRADALPPPLPPERRTVGQLVAETLRLYGRRFWPSLALGVGPALVGLGVTLVEDFAQLVFASTVGGFVLTTSYIGATVLAAEPRGTRRSLMIALAAGVIVFLPVPVLSWGILPVIFWLAFVGLAVPVALIEGRGLMDCFRRAVELARADYVHAAGSLATLAILFFLTTLALFFVLRGQAETTVAAAAFLAVVVISPVLFLGAALLYFDQAARAVSSPRNRERRRDADLHHAHDADRAGRADAAVESRAAARGEP